MTLTCKGKSATALSLVKYNKSTRHTRDSQHHADTLMNKHSRHQNISSESHSGETVLELVDVPGYYWIFHLLFYDQSRLCHSKPARCMFGRSFPGISKPLELTPLKPKTNMRPWKSTNVETETDGNSSWKTSMLGQKMWNMCLQKLPFVNFLRRRMAKDWYLGVCPMRVRRDSPIDTRQISLKPGSDERIWVLELCTWLFF